MAFARLQDSVVVEIITPPQGVEISDMIHPDLRGALVPCPAECELGATWDGATFAPPAPWVPPSMTKQGKSNELRIACQEAILAGFSSAALGAPHDYPSQTVDQINLMGSVAASLLPDLPVDWSTPFWCADADEAWAFRPHTAAQIQAAGADGKAHVVACQQRLDALSRQLEAAATPDEIAAIAWEG